MTAENVRPAACIVDVDGGVCGRYDCPRCGARPTERRCICGVVFGSEHDHEGRMEEGYLASQQAIADSAFEALINGSSE